MIQLFSFFFIASICTVLTGNFFLNLFLNQNNKYEFSFSEKGMYGLIILSFISLFINFFYKIDYFITSVLFLIPAIFIIINLKNISKKFIKKIIIHSIIISLIACIFIAFDNVQRPDGGTYHLPYTKIINDYKIFLGVANLNPFFGVTSIFQYTSAIYNNFLFKDIGIVIPLALLAGFFIDYFFRQFFLNKNNDDLFYKFYIFSIISYFFIEMNRYSDYGNDNPAHIYFFYLISLVLRKDFILSDKTNFKLFTLISLFCFLNRPFLILSLFFPVFYWFKNKLYLSFKSFPFFSLKKRISKSKKAVKKYKRIQVLYLDDKIKSSNTINVINYFIKTKKQKNLCLILGSDNLLNFHKWTNWKKIVKLTKLVIFSRKGYDKKSKESIVVKYLNKKNIIYIQNKPINISSSDIKKCL